MSERRYPTLSRDHEKPIEEEHDPASIRVVIAEVGTGGAGHEPVAVSGVVSPGPVGDRVVAACPPRGVLTLGGTDPRWIRWAGSRTTHLAHRGLPEADVPEAPCEPEAVSITERAAPPMTADEHATLAGWLDFYRDTLAAKCTGLDEEQLRTASAPPSTLTLLGLLQHLAEVERNWFRRVLLGEDAPPLYVSPSSAPGHDGGFDLTDAVTGEQALATWREEVKRSIASCAGRDLGARVPFGEGEVTLRWIYVHMIGEYARHAGHADLVRERIDGTTGV